MVSYRISLSQYDHVRYDKTYLSHGDIRPSCLTREVIWARDAGPEHGYNAIRSKNISEGEKRFGEDWVS